MKRLLLLTALIFITEISFSQTDYRNGYVITNAKDTLFGLVDYREGGKAYKSCSYKVSKDQDAVTYEPTNIIGYGFEKDKTFQSREISIKNQIPQVVFLEVIVKGLVSLYEYENTYFIEKGNGGLQQLINETREVFVEGKTITINTNQYIGTINMLVFDCAELRTKVQKVRLTERNLTNLIEDYNQCKGDSSIVFKAKKPWTKTAIGVTGGLNISQLNFNTIPGYEYLAGDFEGYNSPMIGASLDVLSPRLSERISFHADFLYLASTYYKYSQYSDNNFSDYRNYATIQLQQLKIPIGIRYTFPKRNFTPYLNVGVSSTIRLSSNSKLIQEVKFNSVVSTNENEAVPIRNAQFGLWGGCGVLKSLTDKFSAFVELRYEQTGGIAEPHLANSNQELHSKVSNYQLLIGIRIN